MMYVFFLIVFLIAAYFLTKNKKLMEDLSGMTAAKKYGAENDPLIALSKELGFTYTPLRATGHQKEIYNFGGRITGIYEGFPLSIIMEARGEQADNLNPMVRYAYSYQHDKRVVFEVLNPDNKKFEIMPKSEHVKAKPVGKAYFDAHLQLIGEAQAVPAAVLDFAARAGWFHVKLAKNELTFIDDFYDDPQFTSLAGGMKLMSAVHPIWKSSVKNPHMKVDTVRELLDIMVKTARAL